MKTIYKINTLGILLLLFLLTGCTQSDFNDMNVNAFPPENAKLTSTYTIKELTEKFVDPQVVYSANLIESEDSLIINGIVTTDDNGGNVYKYIVVQEEFEGGRAIRISVGIAGITSTYHLGQRVSVYLNGLHVGNYGRLPQIGVYGKRLQDDRVQPMSMSPMRAKAQIFPYGAPDVAAVVADTMTIAEIRAANKDDMNYKLVCIKDAWFTGRGANYNLPSDISETEKIFAPSTNGVGFPQSREIQDGSGQSIFVSTSEYAKFASSPLPSNYPIFNKTMKGNITALVVWYSTNSSAIQNPNNGEIYYQLTLRSLNDLEHGFEPYHDYLAERLTGEGLGTERIPYNVGAAFIHQGLTSKQWIKGYVVGVLESDSADVKSPFNNKLNILLASSENEINERKLLCVELADSDIQDALNLVENAQLYKTQIVLYGSLETYNNMPGMKSVQYAVLENGRPIGTHPTEE